MLGIFANIIVMAKFQEINVEISNHIKSLQFHVNFCANFDTRFYQIRQFYPQFVLDADRLFQLQISVYHLFLSKGPLLMEGSG